MASKHQNKTIKVPQAEIDKIRSLGMAKAIKEAKSGNASREFVEGVRRFYPAAVAGIDENTTKRATKGVGVKVPDSKKKQSSSDGKAVTPSRDAVNRRLASTNSSGAAKGGKRGKKDTSLVRDHPKGKGKMLDFSPSDQGIKALDNKVRQAMKSADSDIVKPHPSGKGKMVDLSPGNKGIKGLDDYLIRNLKGAGKAISNAAGKTGNRLPKR